MFAVVATVYWISYAQLWSDQGEKLWDWSTHAANKNSCNISLQIERFDL